MKEHVTNLEFKPPRTSPVAWQLLNQNLQVPLPSLFHLLLPQQSLFGCLLPKRGTNLIPKMGFEKSKRKITATSRVGQCQYWYAIWFFLLLIQGTWGCILNTILLNPGASIAISHRQSGLTHTFLQNFHRITGLRVLTACRANAKSWRMRSVGMFKN